MGELTRYGVCRPSLAYTENMEYGANLHIFEVCMHRYQQRLRIYIEKSVYQLFGQEKSPDEILSNLEDNAHAHLLPFKQKGGRIKWASGEVNGTDDENCFSIHN